VKVAAVHVPVVVNVNRRHQSNAVLRHKRTTIEQLSRHHQLDNRPNPRRIQLKRRNEISPTFALDAGHLREVLLDRPTLTAGQSHYWE
jgi:hypothetical protein